MTDPEITRDQFFEGCRAGIEAAKGLGEGPLSMLYLDEDGSCSLMANSVEVVRVQFRLKGQDSSEVPTYTVVHLPRYRGALTGATPEDFKRKA